MRRKPVPIVLPALDRSPTGDGSPHGADHVAVKYGHGYRPDDAGDDEAPGAGQVTSGPSPPRYGKALTARGSAPIGPGASSQRAGAEAPIEPVSGAVSPWPANRKGGSKPELLKQLEKYLHQQLMVIHHMAAPDRETVALMRLDMARHCVREFQRHFKIYAEVLSTVGDTLDGVDAVFDMHRQQLDTLTEARDRAERTIAELKRERVQLQRQHEEELSATNTIAARLAEVDEDRKVLQALCDDLQRQLSKQRQFVDAAQERLDAMSRQHVLQTMRDERQRQKMEQAEHKAADAHARIVDLEKDTKTLRSRVEMGDLENTKLQKELRVLHADVGALNSVIVAKEEEIRMLRFDLKRRGVATNASGVIELDDNARRTLIPAVEAELRRTMTPRPVWRKLELTDPELFPDLKATEETPQAVATDESDLDGTVNSVRMGAAAAGGPDDDRAATGVGRSAAHGAPGASAEVASADDVGPIQPPPALVAKVAATRTPRASSITPSQAGSQTPRMADLNAAVAADDARPSVPSSARIEELVRALNTHYKAARGLEEENLALRKRLVVYETLQHALGGVAFDSPKSPLASSGNDGRAGAKGKGASGGGRSGGGRGGKKDKEPKEQEPDNVFVALGTAETVPPFLRAPETNHTIGLRPMPEKLVAQLIFTATRYVSLWLSELDPPRAYSKHQGVVGDVDRGPTFAVGFAEWLSVELRERRAAAERQKLQQAGGTGAAIAGSPLGSPTIAASEAIAASADFSQEFSLEMSYSFIHRLFTLSAEPSRNGLCRLFLLTLGGDIPRDTMSRFEMRLRGIRRAFEEADPQGTGGVLPLELGLALRKALPDFATHFCDALAELIEQTQQSRPHALSRVAYDDLLAPDSKFVQCFATFFLETLEFHLSTTKDAVQRLSDEHKAEPVPLQSVVLGLQSADPRLDPEVARLYLSDCCRAMVSKASRIPVALLQTRIYEVYSQRRTPVEMGAVTTAMRIEATLPAPQLQLSLHNVGEVAPRFGKGARPPAQGKPVNPARRK